ncbi:HAAS signaling domain-containing protein [Cryptosporangium phraense]|uniref:Uncharacterized protein n=1 Tax=Cryptosporangium phraense TaxID=2593070 RepID=A0A545AIB9_9ACTN|nr:hypothetical protein [Cryptosporangium phraense]TQS40435.1 hypothetical protein FL583_34905 [Cryptosporangium phraense]
MDLIDSYVADVVELLPRRQRADVARELRELLIEEVQDGGAEEVLRRFGHPAEVAARYGQPVTLIDPADTRRFLTLAVGGAVLIHLAAFLDELIKPVHDLGRAPDTAWPLVFAWLGVLFARFAARAWYRRRRPAEWKPHRVPTGRINRLGRVAAVVFFVAGTVVLIDPAGALRVVTGGRAAPAAYDALAYDDGFLRLRGPVVLALLVSGIALQAVTAWAGRWSARLLAVDLVHSLVACAVLTWAIGTGPIFVRAAADETVKGIVALIILLTLVDLAVRARRLSVAAAVGH